MPLYVSFCRPEVNIRPWEILKEDLKEGNKNIEWMDREPYAYWKGNIRLGATRKDLLKCNASDEQDWKVRIFNLVRSKIIIYIFENVRDSGIIIIF